MRLVASMERQRRPAAALIAAVFCCACLVMSAEAFVDRNLDKIDDRIEDVHVYGWNAAFVDGDPTARMRIGVENPALPVFAIYVGYDHRPAALDEATLSATGVSMVWPFQNIDYIESRATWAQIEAISGLPGVTRVEAVPVEYALNHYGSRVVRARDARGLTASENYALFPSARGNLGFDGNGIVIAILDTGVNDDADPLNPDFPGHESLAGKFLGGGEFWCGQPLCSTPADGSTNPQDHGGDVSSFHATHVAATAMGTGGLDGFFTGVAPGARLVDCKVLSDAGASVGGSTRGLDWCISNKNTLWVGLPPGSIWQGIDVANLSLGSTECATGTGTSTGAGSQIVNAAVDAGIVVVIATGNDSAIDCISSPAAADKSIAVGASTHNRTLDRSDDRVTTFSNEGVRDDDGDADHFDEMKPSVVAPGAGIISADGDFLSDGTAYQQLSGTSMASPHVAGCAALILEAAPGLAPLEVRTILQNTADHDVPTLKASGDRGQDPYGLDANYDPSCGWGLVDVYAACKEALNSTSGVQVVQIRPVAMPQMGKIDLTWATQREYPFQGFNVYRAPDLDGVPGAFVQLNPLVIAPSGDPVIEGDDNRTVYTYSDTDAALMLGDLYWYQVEWLDLGGAGNLEPPAQVAYGTPARVATVYYQIVHNTVDNDLLVRVGSDLDYDPGMLGDATFEVLGPGEAGQDSARVVLPPDIPANTGTSTVGTIEHFWSVGFKEGDGAEPFLPPTLANPWFLYVLDGGFVNRTGRVTAFSMFVNDEPGSSSGTTYVTEHQPMPQPLVEGGEVPAILWIPEQSVTTVESVSFRADVLLGSIRLALELARAPQGVTALVYRSLTDDFESRELLTPEPLNVRDVRFEYTDGSVRPGVSYHYWIELSEAGGRTLMNGPVSAAVPATFAAPPHPNPVARGAVFSYVLGTDAAGSGMAEVSLVLHDVQGRVIRTLKRGREGAGQYSIAWNGTDDRGARVASGVYYMRFRAGSLTQDLKVLVVR